MRNIGQIRVGIWFGVNKKACMCKILLNYADITAIYPLQYENKISINFIKISINFGVCPHIKAFFAVYGLKTSIRGYICMGTRRNNCPVMTNFNRFRFNTKIVIYVKFHRDICKIATLPTY